MPYATRATVILAAGGLARAVQLADWNADKQIDDDVIDQAIAAADGLINAFLAVRYTVPISNPNDLVKDLAAAGAVYWIRDQRNMNTADDQKAYDQRIALLKAMQEGRAAVTEPVAEVGGVAGQSAFVEFDSPVSRKNSRGMW